MASCPYGGEWRADLGAWSIPGTQASRAILTDPRFCVRPPEQRLPAYLENTLLGKQFSHWLRQRDDGHACDSKTHLSAALSALAPEHIHRHARRQSALAFTGGWRHWAWATPVSSTASLLGLPLYDLDSQKTLLAHIAAIASGLRGENVAAADRGCDALLTALMPSVGPLQQCIDRFAPVAAWRDRDDYAANRLALLWQSYEAGAALLSNATQRMAGDSGLIARTPLRTWLAGLAGNGGGVLNTRRYAPVSGTSTRPENPGSETFLLNLAGDLGFGIGQHRCPGKALAIETIASALEWLIDAYPGRWPRSTDTLELPNARIPQFLNDGEAQ